MFVRDDRKGISSDWYKHSIHNNYINNIHIIISIKITITTNRKQYKNGAKQQIDLV